MFSERTKIKVEKQGIKTNKESKMHQQDIKQEKLTLESSRETMISHLEVPPFFATFEKASFLNSLWG